jgi:hypothetical protein
MSTTTASIEKMIDDSMRKLTKTKAFTDWFNSQQISDGDLILINNSFIYRKPFIKTTKNSQYIGLKTKNKELDFSNVSIAIPSDFDADFKVLNSKDKSLPLLEPLSQAVKREISHLGQLVFFLIGELIEIPLSVEIQNSTIHELKFDPLAKKQEIVETNGVKIFVVNQLTDPEIAWNSVKSDIEKLLGNNISTFERVFTAAFEKLQNEARLEMNLPDSSTDRTNNSFIARLRQSVIEQRRLYKLALNRCISGNDENDINLREVMRIAYNFAYDAIKLLQLFVSITDLKAVLLWSTLKAHHDVAEAFRNLPWTKSDQKPSPGLYVEKVKGARNRAFHNLLFFDRTIEADLDGIQVNAKRLTLLPPYSQRKTTIALDYEDREIVEILKELTRAPETIVSIDFWIKNSAVIETFENLLESTEDALWMLNSIRNG